MINITHGQKGWWGEKFDFVPLLVDEQDSLFIPNKVPIIKDDKFMVKQFESMANLRAQLIKFKRT